MPARRCRSLSRRSAHRRFRRSTADTFRTWSLLETVISVAGLVMVVGLSYLV
ncbi:hypothetical protein ACH0AI_00430 [Sphingomonas sp. 179-A 4D3 NHS]